LSNLSVEIDRIGSSPESWEPQTAPTPWHSRAGEEPSTASEADIEHSLLCSLSSSTESPASARQLRGSTTHGEATEVKLGGFSAPTQDVSGASGAARNETITA